MKRDRSNQQRRGSIAINIDSFYSDWRKFGKKATESHVSHNFWGLLLLRYSTEYVFKSNEQFLCCILYISFVIFNSFGKVSVHPFNKWTSSCIVAVFHWTNKIYFSIVKKSSINLVKETDNLLCNKTKLVRSINFLFIKK